MSPEQIKHMVSRFLSWQLPENFSPDCGITFTPDFNQHTPWPMKHEPVGTNLFSADQAEAMIRHLVEGLPARHPISSEDDNAGGDDTARAGETEQGLSEREEIARIIDPEAFEMRDRCASYVADHTIPYFRGREAARAKADLILARRPSHVPADTARAGEETEREEIARMIWRRFTGLPDQALAVQAAEIHSPRVHNMARNAYASADDILARRFAPADAARAGEVDALERVAKALYRLNPVWMPNPSWSEGADEEVPVIALDWDTELPDADKLPYQRQARAALSAALSAAPTPTQEGADDNAGAGDTGGEL